MKLVRIYSNEHGAWWEPDYCGYTSSAYRAGIFNYEEAVKKYPDITYNHSDEDFFVDVGVSELKSMITTFDYELSDLQKRKAEAEKLLAIIDK